MTLALIVGTALLLACFIITGWSLLWSSRRLGFRQVKRAIRREAEYAKKRMLELEREARRFPPVESKQGDASAK
jgi:hypothetical protein